MGQLVFQATAGGQVALVGPNPSSSFSINVPAVNSTLATLAAQTFAGTQTFSVDALINGLTVGKGGGSVATNTVVGASAMTATNTGGYNTALGNGALTATTAGGNVGVGYNALTTNSTGLNNTAIGTQSLNTNSSGAYNTSVGLQSLYSNTTANNNTAVGYQALYANTTGTGLVAVGHQALQSNTTGVANTAVGGSYTGFSPTALSGNTTGSYNIALGSGALGANTTASGSTAVGYQAGYSNSSNGANCFFGYQAGSNNTTGYYSIYIGYAAQPSASSNHDEIVIGSNGSGKGSNTGSINPGGGPVYQGNNSATWSIVSDVRLKKNIVDNTIGLNAISQIQVRNFEYRTKDEITELPPQNAIEKTGVQLGAIAQELQAILPDCVRTESTGVMSVNTENLTWYLINAIKELNAKIIALENK